MFQNWFSLIAVPVLLTTIFSYACLFYHSNLPDSIAVLTDSEYLQFLSSLKNIPLGVTILAGSVWLMYITVGWHYSKQVFGCMMIYSFFDAYALTKSQRLLIKLNLFSVAIFNFFHFIKIVKNIYPNGNPYFYNIQIGNFPSIPYAGFISAVLVVASMISVISIFYTKYRNEKKLPSANFLISWLSFHFWWVPLAIQPEFFLITVPFFHSLQYLPFPYKMEKVRIPTGKWNFTNLGFRILLLLLISFLAFEIIPDIFDQAFDTKINGMPFFFTVSALVFINIHHFFIDSVIWKFDQNIVRESLLHEHQTI